MSAHLVSMRSPSMFRKKALPSGVTRHLHHVDVCTKISCRRNLNGCPSVEREVRDVVEVVHKKLQTMWHEVINVNPPLFSKVSITLVE